MSALTAERVRELFSYENGALIWRINGNCRQRAGHSAGYWNEGSSTHLVGINSKKHTRASLVWAWHHGRFAGKDCLAHRNHNSRDDRIGCVDERLVIGRAFFLLVPGGDSQHGESRDWSRIGVIG